MVFNLEILPSLTPGGGGGGVEGVKIPNPRCHQPSRKKGMLGSESTSHNLNEGLVFSMCYSVDLFFLYMSMVMVTETWKWMQNCKILGHNFKSLFSCTLASKLAKNVLKFV